MLVILSAAYVFWWYSGFRTFGEEVGFNLKYILVSIAFSFFFFLPVIVLVRAILSSGFKEVVQRYFVLFIVASGGLLTFITIQFIPFFGLGFSVNYIMATLAFFVLLIFTPLIVLITLVLSGRFKERVLAHLVIFAMVGGGLIGIIIGESTILLDEAAFRREVEQAEFSGLDSYGRARAWPNGTGSLVWNRGRGIHATD